MSKVVINDTDEMIKLDNIRIRDREMLPEVIMATNKSTETHTDAEGNVVGYVNRIERVSSINLRPEEYYNISKKTRKTNAEEDKTKKK